MNIQELNGCCLRYELVGSRVTCDPAPTDTDQDVLVLTTRELWADKLDALLNVEKFEKGGSEHSDESGYLANAPLSFASYVRGDLNLIITFDSEFYRRFMAATGVAKHLNLLVKADRVMLFQAVLYGSPPVVTTPMPAIGEPLTSLPAFPPPPPPLYVSPYWVSGEKGSGCIEAYSDPGARADYLELYGVEPEKCELLPYPAQPRLKVIERPGLGTFPSFCYEPHKCKGRSSCPQRMSCTE